jgi:hypothetical protein
VIRRMLSPASLVVGAVLIAVATGQMATAAPAVGVVPPAAAARPVPVAAAAVPRVPDDPGVLGWWRDGAAPGSATGTVVLAGHVDSRELGPGALFRLADLRLGDPIAVRARRRVIDYAVQAVRRYPKAALPGEVFDRAGAARLVLISCGGAFDRARRSYADNVVVYAVPRD